MRKTSLKTKILLGTVLLAAMAIVSTYAWSVDASLTTDPTKVYVTSNPGTATTISGYSSKPLGKNQIKISFTSAGGSADIEWMFLDTSGNVIACDQTVKIDGGSAITPSSDHTYTKASLANGAHTITIDGTGVWKDLDSVTGGDQTFNGLMIVIK